MIWIISLRMFFVFKVEILGVLGGFKAWFQQSFWTSEIKISSWCLGVLDGLAFFKCLKMASIYKSLGVGERHVMKSDW